MLQAEGETSNKPTSALQHTATPDSGCASFTNARLKLDYLGDYCHIFRFAMHLFFGKVSRRDLCLRGRWRRVAYKESRYFWDTITGVRARATDWLLLWARIDDDSKTKVSHIDTQAIFQWASQRIHDQSLGFIVEKCQRETTCRLVTLKVHVVAFMWNDSDMTWFRHSLH